ncbi:hypothetical protein EGK75_12755 [Neisseria weixii]|uniref:Uncharacterized protein n=1 Tax=Neisseria weixii TaxID=1853276 RepID=A0A3N4N7W8_9NEIS|nr:hypothetical protein EGK74_12695 [Neisseria weixii]RPD83755.1 hypothetical protein EGK75_12755 [Neisseria weixii]
MGLSTDCRSVALNSLRIISDGDRRIFSRARLITDVDRAHTCGRTAYRDSRITFAYRIGTDTDGIITVGHGLAAEGDGTDGTGQVFTVGFGQTAHCHVAFQRCRSRSADGNAVLPGRTALITEGKASLTCRACRRAQRRRIDG